MKERRQPREVIKGAIYKHTAGGTLYRIDEVRPNNVEDYEKTGKIGRTVEYTQLADGPKKPAGTQWTRSERNFLSHMKNKSSKLVPIFELVEESG